jgi:transcriptional regulator with XRE-family HTH domain
MSKGMSGQKLARMADVSPAYLSEIERGLSKISSEKLMGIAGSLGVSVQSLLDGRSISASATEVSFPKALAEAADQLGWSYRTMASLYAGKQSLAARRSSGEKEEWVIEDWIRFYDKVKDYLD